MNKIKELRKRKGITQINFCHRFNIAQSTLSGWENEKWQPDSETLIKLAEFFGVSVDYLLGRDEVTLADRLSGWEDSAMEKLSPIEYEMVQRFRDVGKKHGEQGQRALITVAEKML